MTVAAALIVRDAAASLERCLRSVRPHVDEVCVLDTGSTDGTLELLARLAAEPGTPLRVERGEWRDDFAEARSRSFALAAPEHAWLLWLDDDDELLGGENVHRVVEWAEARGATAVLAAYDHHALPGGASHFEWAFRLMRRDAGHWEGVVHEHWRGPDPERDAVVAHPAALRFHHHRREQRPGHYLELLERATADPARTPRAWFYVGRELLATDPARAAEALETYLSRRDDEVEGVWNAFRVAALEALASAYARLGRPQDARAAQTARGEHLAGYRAAVERGEVPDPNLGRRLTAGAAAWVTENPADVIVPLVPARAAGLGRNDPCWCGSGKKLKRCHGA